MVKPDSFAVCKKNYKIVLININHVDYIISFVNNVKMYLLLLLETFFIKPNLQNRYFYVYLFFLVLEM